MAFNIPGVPFKLTPQDMGGFDLAGSLRSGMQTYEQGVKSAYAPKNASEALLAQQLNNKINQAKAQYAMQNEAANLAHTQAGTGLIGEQTRGLGIENQYMPEKLKMALQQERFKLDNPLLNMTGSAGQVGSLLYLQQHPELMGSGGQDSGQLNQGQSFISPINKNNDMNPTELLRQAIQASLQPKSKQYAPSNTIKDLDALRDVESGFVPGTNRSQQFGNKREQEYYINALREKTQGLKSGEHYLYDPDSKDKIGIERPLSAEERKVETGRAFFNEVVPIIRKGSAEFSGKDSIKKLDYYASHYNDDPIAKQKIDDLILSDMALTSGVINEAATLGGGRTNQTFNQLKKGLSTSDIPEKLKKYELGFKIPAEAFKNASIKFQDLINRATERSATGVPATKVNYFHPEKYLKSNEEKDVSEMTEDELMVAAGFK